MRLLMKLNREDLTERIVLPGRFKRLQVEMAMIKHFRWSRQL